MDNFPIDPQVIIFIVVALIGFINSIFFKKKGEEQPYDQEPPFDPNSQEEKDDPLRDFRRMIQEARAEAESKTKTVAPPATHNPPRESAPPTITPQLVINPAPIKAQPTESHSHTVITPPQASKPRQAYSEAKGTKKTSDNLSISALLSSPSAARKAIILTEILGKPKGLR